MVDLSTKYLGLPLKNPIIVGSSGLTSIEEGVKKAADAGAGAVVLKSIFAEQIKQEVESLVSESDGSLWHPEAAAYIANHGKENAVRVYLDLITATRKSVSIPVIASVHASSVGRWTEFAKRAEDAGADALELNAFVFPADPRRSAADNERFYFDAVAALKETVSIPFSLKLGTYFSNLLQTLIDLSETALDGMVLFNRFYNLDIDVNSLELVPARPFSSPLEYVQSLRWISILSGRVSCDIAAATGIHDGNAVIKQILAGASAVQMVSAFYENGIKTIGETLKTLEEWMAAKGYENISEFKGKMAQTASVNPSEYLRVQFMMYSVSQG